MSLLPKSFRHRVVAITGASTGIGAALAVALAKEGAKVVLGARRLDLLDAVARDCRQTGAVGADARAVAVDVTKPEECQRFVNAAIESYGRLDVLVNNAGISMWSRFDDVTDLSIFEKLMQVNYLGSVYCTHAALPHLKKSQGLLVAISSLTGKTGVPTRSGYAASKHAMQGFFDSLRIELLGTGVDVSVISPGFVSTDIRSSAFGPDGQALGESPREEGKSNMTVEECAQLTLEAMRDRRRELVMTRQAQVGMWVKMVAPSVVDRIALRAVKEKQKS